MRKMKLILLFLAMSGAGARAQTPYQDFLISQEDTSCSFSRSYPVVFPDGESRFLIIWQDSRNGLVSYYAQLFDSLGNPVGTNFPIYSSGNVAFSPDNSFLVLGAVYVNYGWPYDDEMYYLYARLCKPDGSWSDPIKLGEAWLPWCGTGWLGIYHDLSPFSGGYMFSFNNGGHISMSKRNWTGDTLWTWEMPDSVSAADSLWPVNISTCFNSAGDFAAVYFGVAQWTGEFRGIAGTFFDNRDSVLAENVVLKNPDTSSAKGVWQNAEIKILRVADTLYEIFTLDRSSNILEYWKLDRTGRQVGESGKITLESGTPTSINSYTWIRNFASSPIVDGKFSFFICIGRSDFNNDVLYRSILDFDEKGNLTGSVLEDSTTDLSFTLGDRFARMQNGTFLLPTSSNDEIYLTDYRDFSAQWTKKVNDNVRGSNDMIRAAIPCDSSNVFVTWNNEKRVMGRHVSTSGIPAGDACAVPSDNLVFLRNGNSVGLSTLKTSDSTISYVYSVYDPGFKVAKTDTLCRNDLPRPVMISMADSSFTVLYSTGSELKLRRVKPDLQYNEIAIPVSPAPSDLQIIDENDTSFWIGYNGKIRLANEHLDGMGQEYVPPAGGIYLGNRRFLVLSQQFQLVTTWGTILSLSGDTLVLTFPISEYADGISFQRLPDDYFAAVKLKGNDISIRTFGADGSPRIDWMPVSGLTDIPRWSPKTCVAGNKLFVGWSEARTPGKGFDVYGRSLDIDKLTAIENTVQNVPTEFVLHQNYPNPFNPTTTISYQVAAVSHVTLTVFDILGRRVKTLVNANQTPGEHSVIFDGSGLASGVYFYRFSTGNHLSVKKMLLLK